MNTKKKDLSDLGHKKRALKAPVSLFKGEKLKAPKIVLSEFEKEIYHLATKRIRDSYANPECVRIGRMSIALREFGDTMRPKKWVGTFAMNVCTEALMYDQNKLENPNLRKGFLTSAEVERQWCFCSSVTSCLQWKDTFPFYSGTFKAIARIIDVLSVCPRGEGADYARNKADCLSTCKFLLSFFSWFLFLCSHCTCSFFPITLSMTVIFSRIL